MDTAPVAVTLSSEQLARFTGYPVSLPIFSGPLDLLIYLIQRHDVDIYDIPIAEITAQFLQYLSLLKEFDIDVAAEFMLMAATLLEIKSRMLLPKPPVFDDSLDEPDEDPRAELVRKLLEYHQYKSAADELNRRAEEQKQLFPRSAVVPYLHFSRPDAQLAGNPDAFSLWTALQEVLARLEVEGEVIREVARPKVTIRKQMLHILRMIEENKSGLAFIELIFFPDRADNPTRLEVIITFFGITRVNASASSSGKTTIVIWRHQNYARSQGCMRNGELMTSFRGKAIHHFLRLPG